MSSARPKIAETAPRVVTAWDTRTGRVVYWAGDARWTGALAQAKVLNAPEGEAALAAARASEAVVTDPYLMEVAATGGVAGREHLRESLRARGPTLASDTAARVAASREHAA
jgi:hypothetical protein